MRCLQTPYIFLDVPPAMYERVRDFIIDKYLGHVMALALKERDKYRKQERNSDEPNSWRQGQIEKKENLVNTCRELDAKPRQYKTQSYTHIQVDLSGWRYRDQVCEERIRNAFYHDEIKVIFDFRGHETRTGVWKEQKAELQIDYPFPTLNIPGDSEKLHDRMAMLSQRIRHELAHVTQSFLSMGSEGRVNGGIPSHNLRPPHTCHRGYQFTPDKPWLKKKRLPHPMRDIEFYPRLDDEIQTFIWELRDIENDPVLRRRAVRLVLRGKDREGSDLLYGSFQELDKGPKHRQQRYCQHQPRFFSYMQYEQPKKYREACRKFVKALTEIDFLR